MDKRKVKRFIGKSVAVLAVAFAILSIVSKRKKRDTVYDNEPEQKNPLEGKRSFLWKTRMIRKMLTA